MSMETARVITPARVEHRASPSDTSAFSRSRCRPTELPVQSVASPRFEPARSATTAPKVWRSVATDVRTIEAFVRSAEELGTNSRPLPPKHDVKRWPCIDQKARKTTTMTWFTKSAKPPSPVQIRAAPPLFQFKFGHFVRRWHRRTLRRWTAVDYRPCAGDAFAFRKLLTPKPLAVRASKKGGGFRNLHLGRHGGPRDAPDRER
jgi:hypothetical protein